MKLFILLIFIFINIYKVFGNANLKNNININNDNSNSENVQNATPNPTSNINLINPSEFNKLSQGEKQVYFLSRIRLYLNNQDYDLKYLVKHIDYEIYQLCSFYKGYCYSESLTKNSKITMTIEDATKKIQREDYR
ncbi:hypothetical protein DICPUDRAFT_84613, partial [Dictyostelium purpureum]